MLSSVCDSQKMVWQLLCAGDEESLNNVSEWKK